MDVVTLAHKVLLGSTPEDKLVTFEPNDIVDGEVPARAPPPEPARAASMRIVSGSDRLPRPGELRSADARAECLHRFANHELQALELMAWAILAFPSLPFAFRAGLARNLHDEQRHFRMYLGRMEQHGVRFGDLPCNGNFWAQAPRLTDPLAFLCAVGLTFESANLDFALAYGHAFRRADALEEAAVMERIGVDETGHVAWAASWVRRLKNDEESLLDAYRRATPFPLGLHRAKGRNFTPATRRAAGLDEEFIRAIRDARSPQEQFPRRARPS